MTTSDRTRAAREKTGAAAETTKDQASAAASGVRDAAGETAQTAREQAGAVAGEAMAQARGTADVLREQIREQAVDQTQRLTSALREMCSDLTGRAEAGDRDTPATRLLHQAAGRGERLAEYLDSHGPDGLLADAQDFARRRPGAFLAGAALAGFAIGRLAKSVRQTTGSAIESTGDPGVGERVPADETLDRRSGATAVTGAGIGETPVTVREGS